MNMLYDNLRDITKKVLRDKLKIESSEDCGLERLDGITNSTFLVTCPLGQYVLKEFGKGTERLVNRLADQIMSKEDPDMEVVYYSLDDQLSIIKYYDNVRNLKIEDINNRRVGLTNRLKMIHFSDLDKKYPYLTFDILEYIDRYYRMVFEEIDHKDRSILHVRSHISRLKDYKEMAYQVAAIISTNSSIRKCMCHNDLVPGNILINTKDDSIKIIDYEYSGINDPAWDYASLFIESYDSPIYYASMSNNKMVKMLESMYDDRHFLVRVTMNMMLQDYLWSLWTVVKLYNGSDPVYYTNYLDHRLSRIDRFISLAPSTLDYFYAEYR